MSRNNLSNYSGNCHEVIVFMDLQPRLLSSIKNANCILATCSILGQASEILGVPAFLTEQVPDKLGRTESSLVNSLKKFKLIEKDTFSAFGSDAFSNSIRKLTNGKLILAGIETSICIYLTAIDAISRGLQVTIISDGIGCRRENDGMHCLSQMQYFGADIVPLETYLFSKLKSSDHPCFKDISRLIKSRE